MYHVALRDLSWNFRRAAGKTRKLIDSHRLSTPACSHTATKLLCLLGPDPIFLRDQNKSAVRLTNRNPAY
jgi:hypothetical protein